MLLAILNTLVYIHDDVMVVVSHLGDVKESPSFISSQGDISPYSSDLSPLKSSPLPNFLPDAFQGIGNMFKLTIIQPLLTAANISDGLSCEDIGEIALPVK